MGDKIKSSLCKDSVEMSSKCPLFFPCIVSYVWDKVLQNNANWAQ